MVHHTRKCSHKNCPNKISDSEWFCVDCKHEIDRERIWQEAGFNPDDKTPFNPEFWQECI